MLFLDIDRFKLVNDSLSHAVGDKLLIALSGRLAAALRPGDTVARLGGDEFTVLLEDVADADEALVVAERMLGALDGAVRDRRQRAVRLRQLRHRAQRAGPGRG